MIDEKELNSAVIVIRDKQKEVNQFATDIKNWSVPNFDEDFMKALETTVNAIQSYLSASKEFPKEEEHLPGSLIPTGSYSCGRLKGANAMRELCLTAHLKIMNEWVMSVEEIEEILNRILRYYVKGECPSGKELAQSLHDEIKRRVG